MTPLYPDTHRHPDWIYQATIDGTDVYILRSGSDGLIQWGPGDQFSFKGLTSWQPCPSQQAIDFANSILALSQ